jgi:hypothetical protein
MYYCAYTNKGWYGLKQISNMKKLFGSENNTCALDATWGIVHPECVNCIMLIIYEWGHGPGVTIGNNAECTVCRAGKGIKGEFNRKKKEKKGKKIGINHSFINPFIAFATATLDSFVTSGIASTSLSLFAYSTSSLKISLPCWAEADGRLLLQTATMLDTVVIICVRFSLGDGVGVGARTLDRTLWMA